MLAKQGITRTLAKEARGAAGRTAGRVRRCNLAGERWASLDIDGELDPEPSEAWEARP